jgi:hypothetical protein
MQSPRSLALLGSDVAAPADALAANPAADSQRAVAMMYAPTPLAIEGSWDAAVGGLYAFDNAHRVGAAVVASAFQEIYSEQRASVQYAHAFSVSKDTSRSIVVGARLKYTSEHFGGAYMPLSVATADVGLTFDLLSNLRVGVAITDLASLARNQDLDAAARTTYAGLSWKALDDVSIHCALEAPQNEDVSVLAGVECMLDPHVVVRAGAERAIGEFAAGVGLHYTNLQFDMAVLHHPVLGGTLSFGLVYAL